MQQNNYGTNPLKHLSKNALESANIERFAHAYGLTCTRLNNQVFVAEDLKGSTIGFRTAASNLSSILGGEICGDKAACKALLLNKGIPTAFGLRMPHKGRKSARRFVQEHGWPVVIKPLRGAGGRAVTANIIDQAQLDLAISEADGPNGFLIEQHVPGEDYRFLVLGDEVIGVWRRDAANVVGDGKNNIDTLIDQKNLVRAGNPHLASRGIKKDQLVINHLLRSGKSLETVPDRGEKVYLRSAANLSAGGDNIEITDETHQSIKDIAIEAKQALPAIELVGVDILMEDHRRSAAEQNVNICEINSLPGISSHDFPTFGPPRNATKQYFDFVANRSNVLATHYLEQRKVSLEINGAFPSKVFKEFVMESARKADVEVTDIVITPTKFSAVLIGTATSIAVLNTLAVAPRAVYGRVLSSTIRTI